MMRYAWILRRRISACLYSLVERMPEAWRRRIAIILALLKRDWRTIRFLDAASAELSLLREKEIEERLHGLDRASVDLVKRHIGRSQFIASMDWVTSKAARHSFLWAGLCTTEEYRHACELVEHEIPLMLSRFGLPEDMEGADGSASSLIYHHGLYGISPAMQGYVKNKVIVDAGAYAGESTIVFLSYQPLSVHAFEPSAANRELFRKTIEQSGVDGNRVVLVAKGLSSVCGAAYFSEDTSGTSLRGPSGACRVDLTTLDKYVRGSGIPTVGMIKADVEGMGLDLLKGALEVIRRDLPILSLCIYHNQEELLGTYELLRQQNLPYDYQVKSFCMPWENTELVLLAYPRID